MLGCVTGVFAPRSVRQNGQVSVSLDTFQTLTNYRMMLLGDIESTFNQPCSMGGELGKYELFYDMTRESLAFFASAMFEEFEFEFEFGWLSFAS